MRETLHIWCELICFDCNFPEPQFHNNAINCIYQKKNKTNKFINVLALLCHLTKQSVKLTIYISNAIITKKILQWQMQKGKCC